MVYSLSLSLSLSPLDDATPPRWNYVGAQREGTWCKTRSKYVPGSPPLDLEDLLARFLRVPAIHADEKSANLERLYVSCVPSPGREMANFLRRERERHSPPPPVSLDAARGTTATLKFTHLPLSLTRNFTRKISSLYASL